MTRQGCWTFILQETELIIWLFFSTVKQLRSGRPSTPSWRLLGAAPQQWTLTPAASLMWCLWTLTRRVRWPPPPSRYDTPDWSAQLHLAWEMCSVRNLFCPRPCCWRNWGWAEDLKQSPPSMYFTIWCLEPTTVWGQQEFSTFCSFHFILCPLKLTICTDTSVWSLQHAIWKSLVQMNQSFLQQWYSICHAQAGEDPEVQGLTAPLTGSWWPFLWPYLHETGLSLY